MSEVIKRRIGRTVDHYIQSRLNPISLAYKDLKVEPEGTITEGQDEIEKDELITVEKSGLTLICILGIG